MQPGSVVIAGIGHTAYGKLPDRSTISLNVEATRKALADAGLDKDAVDALFVKYPTSKHQSMYAQTLAEALGIVPKIGGVWDQGGAANISMIAFAALSIEAGQCDVAVVTTADNPRSGTRQAYERAWGDDGVHGWGGIPGSYAMIAQRHMQEFGTTSEQFAQVSITCRKHGAANPHAQLRKPITLEDHQSSPWMVEPLRRDDCCLVSDTGAAVVLTGARRARELGVARPVPILGFGGGQTSWEVAQRPVLTETAARVSGATAFRMAGLEPKDIDCAQFYDCFSFVPIMTMEDYGFCKKGEGGKFVEDGALEVGGVLPLNTSGGLMSETGSPGMPLVIEAVRQMRGTSSSQVPDARTCIVSNQGGVMHTHATLIVGGAL